MIYGSVCSGIEAATVAWHPLGWRPAFFSEIEAFPRALLAHHYPEVPLHGDFTTIQAGDYRPIDLLVGGTPCQSFSIAGLRGGLADERGNLALEYLRLADRLRPTWLVWENVPGVLSSSGGRDFGAFLGGLVELGYGFAYRVLDAQFFGVAQRRRRVFVVGYLGDWRPAAAVLFEPHSLSGHPPPRRAPGQGIAGTIGASSEDWSRDNIGEGLIPFDTTQITSAANYSCPASGDPCHPLAAGAHAPAIAWSIMPQNSGRDYKARAVDVAQPLMAGRTGAGGNQGGDIIQTVAFHANAQADQLPTESRDTSVTDSLTCSQSAAVATAMQVRRLTPTECERLQGFPDGYTAIPYRNKPAADGPRYKALGNSMAVPVMRWIGQRIEQVHIHLNRRRAA